MFISSFRPRKILGQIRPRYRSSGTEFLSIQFARTQIGEIGR